MGGGEESGGCSGANQRGQRTLAPVSRGQPLPRPAICHSLPSHAVNKPRAATSTSHPTLMQRGPNRPANYVVWMKGDEGLWAAGAQGRRLARITCPSPHPPADSTGAACVAGPGLLGGYSYWGRPCWGLLLPAPRTPRPLIGLQANQSVHVQVLVDASRPVYVASPGTVGVQTGGPRCVRPLCGHHSLMAVCY